MDLLTLSLVVKLFKFDNCALCVVLWYKSPNFLYNRASVIHNLKHKMLFEVGKRWNNQKIIKSKEFLSEFTWIQRNGKK